MSGFYRLIGIVAAVCLSSVTGIYFTLSRSQINLGKAIEPYWTMNCSVNNSDVISVLYIKILHEPKNTGRPWQVLATVNTTGTVLDDLPSDLNDNNVRAEGILYETVTANRSKLVVSMDSASLSCDDERKYRCELSYLQSDPFKTVHQAQNATLTVSAPASTPLLRDIDNYEGSVFNPKDMAVGEILTLKCEANIGTDSSRTISWRKSFETTNTLEGYNGYVDDGTAEVDNSGGSATSCLYRPDGSGIYPTTSVMSSTDVSENDECVRSNKFVVGFVSGFGICLCSALLVGLIFFLYKKRQNNASKATALRGKDEHFYENSISADVLRITTVHSEDQGQENILQVTAQAHNNTNEEMRQPHDESESAAEYEIPTSSNSDQQYYTSLSIEPGEHVYKDLSSR